jgi:adenine-specific DNA-methyltransferase
VLLSRYLGGKTEILPPILGLVERFCAPGDRVLDAFTGSLAVSMALKGAGYEVAGTDLNALSATYAGAYLLPTAPEHLALDAGALLGRPVPAAVDARLASLRGRPGWGFLADPAAAEAYRGLLALLGHLDGLDPRGAPRTHFFDAYSPDGGRAAFRSSRGRSGTRRFFTGPNALRLDVMLGQLREWRAGGLPPAVLDLLTAVVCHASEKVANTQGTWHDFPRDTWDSRAFKPLTLAPPPLDGVLTGGVLTHDHGREEDSEAYAARLAPVRLAYLDPPYNFRQYTAYYHLPNLLCRYPHLDDPDAWFDGLAYVRGQNMTGDRSSQFCGTRSFVPALRRLLAAVPAEVVVLSYFTGRNHWARFDSESDDTGLHLLGNLLSEDTFEPGSLEVLRVPRTNYASYGGFTARTIDELLLVARKRRPVGTAPTRRREAVSSEVGDRRAPCARCDC